MKPNIHPTYRTVVFHDTTANEYFKVGSTIKTDREIELEGKRILTLLLMSPLNHIRFTPGSRRPSRQMAARHASASVLAAFLMRSEANHAGA